MRRRYFACFAVCIAVSAYSLGDNLSAQQSAPTTTALFPTQHVVAQVARSDSGQAELQTLNKLRQQLKHAAAEERSQLENQLREALVEYFAADMQQRREELDRLKKRVDDMQALLEKRAAAKQSLVDLQLKSFQHEAQGLGLFNSDRKRNTTSTAPLGYSPVTLALPAYVGTTVQRSTNFQQVEPSPLQVAMDKVDAARRDLSKAETDEDQTKATDELRQALSEYFDRDMDSRRQETRKVAEGLEDMTQRLKKRADAEDEIIDLQLQMFVNEADGLGFFSKTDASQSFYSTAPSGAR